MAKTKTTDTSANLGFEAKLWLAAALPKIDAEFDEITEGEEQTRKEKLKTKWAALEALVGDPKRIALIAGDLVTHFEKRIEAMDGNAMIVCMSRRICVDLYDALIKLRPAWASVKDDDAEAEKSRDCVVKVVMELSRAFALCAASDEATAIRDDVSFFQAI